MHSVTTQGAQQECSAFAAQYLATLKQNASTTRMLSGALVDKDALRHGMCIGVVASQRGTVGLGYLHQNLASLLSGAPPPSFSSFLIPYPVSASMLRPYDTSYRVRLSRMNNC